MTSAYGQPTRTNPQILERALAGTRSTPFWIDDVPLEPLPALSTHESTDLLVVGGGYAGLWTALQAKERDPDRSVILVEARTAGWAASGRNGGFCESSLTHGDTNGERHFAADMPVLGKLAAENFEGIATTIERYAIDAEFERTGMLQVATEDYQVEGIREEADASGEQFLDAAAVRQLLKSPLLKAGVHLHDGIALLHPMKLVAGLRTACLTLGVQIFENTPARGLRRNGDRMMVDTPHGSVTATRVALATNAFPALLRRARLLTVPVYDYALMSEPLSAAQLQSIGWSPRFGLADSSRQFHYSRLTADNRILYGGYDAIYHSGGRIIPSHDSRPETFTRLADHFFRTFPQLEELGFSHAWGGAIDMSTRLTAHTATAHGGRVAYTAGYTGLGVGATRFGAQIMLDLLDGADTELTRLKMARSLPMPMPPEPFATPAIGMTRAAVARSDESEGRDGPLLKLMGLLGVGFDT
jgi:glycine/D-amino acid oxidase-like deaminating enzyme